MKERIRLMEELQITEQELEKILKKRKSWSAAPEIDGISNFWWKTLRST